VEWIGLGLVGVLVRGGVPQELFFPRMDLVTRTIREAGPRHIQRGIRRPTGEFKMSRRCPRKMREGGPDCPVHAEFTVENIRTVLLFLAERGVWETFQVTDQEMQRMIRQPRLMFRYLAARPELSIGHGVRPDGLDGRQPT